MYMPGKRHVSVVNGRVKLSRISIAICIWHGVKKLMTENTDTDSNAD